MIKESKVQYERIEHHRFCDKCGEEIRALPGVRVAKCMYCNKDLCEKCVAYEDSNLSTHRIVYCNDCWNIGEEYRRTIDELSSKIQSLYKEWQDKCKVLNNTSTETVEQIEEN